MADIIDFTKYKSEKHIINGKLDINDIADCHAIKRKIGETDGQLKIRIERAILIDRICERSEKMDW